MLILIITIVYFLKNGNGNTMRILLGIANSALKENMYIKNMYTYT